jgi:hypothetical protein
MLETTLLVLDATFTVFEAIDERRDSDERIWVFIENKTNEALVLYTEVDLPRLGGQ